MDTPLQLLSLPNESLLNIIIKTSNVDLDSFASTCTTIYNLATNALQGHQKRKRQYSSITYGDPEATGDNTTWVHPTLMLRDLLTVSRSGAIVPYSIHVGGGLRKRLTLQLKALPGPLDRVHTDHALSNRAI